MAIIGFGVWVKLELGIRLRMRVCAPRVGVAHEQEAEAAAAQRVRDREDLGQRRPRALQQRDLPNGASNSLDAAPATSISGVDSAFNSQHWLTPLKREHLPGFSAAGSLQQSTVRSAAESLPKGPRRRQARCSPPFLAHLNHVKTGTDAMRYAQAERSREAMCAFETICCAMSAEG